MTDGYGKAKIDALLAPKADDADVTAALVTAAADATMKANAAQAYAIDRSHHTGTQAAGTITGLGSLATVTPTGTPDGTKFLRDDNSWAAPPGAASGLTAAAMDVYILAGSDAPAAVQAAANAVCGAGGAAGNAAKIVAAHASGKTVWWYGTIELDTQAVITDTTKRVIFIGRDSARCIAPQGMATDGTRNAGFQVKGTYTTVSPTWVGTTFAEGSRTLTYSSASLVSTLPVGTQLKIKTTEIHNPDRATQDYDGELNEVIGITSTTITLARPLRRSYLTAQFSIRKQTVHDNVLLDGIAFDCHDDAVTMQEAMIVQDCNNPVISDCSTNGGLNKAGQIGIAVARCRNAKVIRPFVQNHTDGQNLASAGPGGYLGYGVYVAGCENTWIEGLKGTVCRHAFDVGTYGSAEWGISRKTTIDGGIAWDTDAAGASFHDYDEAVLRDWTSLNCGGGVIVRGPGVTIENLTVRGTQSDTQVWYSSTAISNATYAANVTTDILTLTAHGLSNGDVVRIATSAVGGLRPGYWYYVVSSTANTLQLAATSGGAAINLTGSNGNVSMSLVTPRTQSTTHGLYLGEGPETATIGTGLTVTAATDRITATAHGLVAGNRVQISSSTATGLSNTIYYVVSPNTNDFQVSTTQGGAAVNITADGTATVATKVYVGRAGEDLSILNADIDVRNGSSLSAHCIFGQDGLQRSRIIGRKLLVPAGTANGIYIQGDDITDCHIDVLVDGSGQTGVGNGVRLENASDSTGNPQQVSRNRIRVQTQALRGAAMYLDGGIGTGVSSYNEVEVCVTSLGTGMTAASSQMQFGTGAHSDNRLRMTCPGTNALSAVLYSGTVLRTRWDASRFADAHTAPSRRVGAAAAGGYIQSDLAAAAAAAVTSGLLTLTRISVKAATPIDQIGVWVGSTVETTSAGTTTRLVGLYHDDGSGTLPVLAGGPIVSGTVSLASANFAGIAAAYVVPPGEYWVAFLYNTNGATVTQVGQVFAYSSGSLDGFATQLGQSVRGYTASGQTALPTTQIALSLAGGSTVVAAGFRTA